MEAVPTQIRIPERAVRLGLPAASKSEAIAAAGQLLLECGFVAPGYSASMLRRETVANTYLAHGIAIPHGRREDGRLVLATGVAVAQFPRGVDWGEGETVYLVVAIAARDDEHLPTLAALTAILDRPEVAQRLATTQFRDEIIAAFNGAAATREPSGNAAVLAAAGQISASVRIRGRAGLHARPASQLVAIAQRYRAEVRIEFAGRSANAKSMAALLKLGAAGNATVTVCAQGEQAQQAVAALIEAIQTGFDLDDSPAEAANPPRAAQWRPPSSQTTMTGTAGGPGFAIGPIYRDSGRKPRVEDRAADPRGETERLALALAAVRAELGAQQSSLLAAGRPDGAAIFAAHERLLDDPELSAELSSLLERSHDAAWAWQEVTNRYASDLRRLADERLAARADDWLDLGDRVIRQLTRWGETRPAAKLPPSILLIDTLSPSEAARLDPDLVLGLCIMEGGPTAHATLLARSLGIPVVVGTGPVDIAAGTVVILDGDAGKLYPAPIEATLESARTHQTQIRSLTQSAWSDRYLPAILTGGVRVFVGANLGAVADATKALAAGAEGIGLLRTEFLFLDRKTPPSEDEQFEAYRTLAKVLAGLPLTLRTLDIGGDKPVRYLDLQREENPFLGLRGIRLSLAHLDLFRTQLRAVYRAASAGPIHLMFPMISTVSEIRQVKLICEQVRQELSAPKLKLGIMIEVPSAALMAAELSREVDFFSIGTNDLTQYVLATDREHPLLGGQADSLDPAVLRLIDAVVRNRQPSCEIAVCGNAAGEWPNAAILAGLGVSHLSMDPTSIPGIKSALRGITVKAARALAAQALACATTGDVRRLYS